MVKATPHTITISVCVYVPKMCVYKYDDGKIFIYNSCVHSLASLQLCFYLLTFK